MADDEPRTPRVRHLFTAAQAEAILGIPAGTVRSWFARKRIYHFGIDEHGNPMFDRDHLIGARDRRTTRDQHAQARRASRKAVLRHRPKPRRDT